MTKLMNLEMIKIERTIKDLLDKIKEAKLSEDAMLAVVGTLPVIVMNSLGITEKEMTERAHAFYEKYKNA